MGGWEQVICKYNARDWSYLHGCWEQSSRGRRGTTVFIKDGRMLTGDVEEAGVSRLGIRLNPRHRG